MLLLAPASTELPVGGAFSECVLIYQSWIHLLHISCESSLTVRDSNSCLDQSYRSLSITLSFSLFSPPSQWFVPAAGQRGADLPPLLWGHPGLAVSQRSPAPHPLTPPALRGGGARRQQLGPHHGLRQALGAVPRGPAVPGERRGPGAAGRGPSGVLPPAEGSLLQPPARGEGGSLPASYASSGHQQEDRLLSLWAEGGLDCPPVAGQQPHQQWRWVSEAWVSHVGLSVASLSQIWGGTMTFFDFNLSFLVNKWVNRGSMEELLGSFISLQQKLSSELTLYYLKTIIYVPVAVGTPESSHCSLF